MKLQFGLILIFSCLLFSCKTDTPIAEDDVLTDEVDSTTEVIIEGLDTIKITYVSETAEKENIKKEIEEKFGKQWDFCDCVRKNDSISKVIEKMGDNDDYDPVFARMEEIDNRCKEILNAPNTTPEERENHKKRVKKCLKAKK